MSIRILVTGSRHWEDRRALSSALRRGYDHILQSHPEYMDPPVLVHGGAKGADQMAAGIAYGLGWQHEEHKADWNTHGKGAGHKRNQAMVDAGADILIACPLPGSKGTWDCMRRAVEAGIPVYVVNGSGTNGRHTHVK